MAYDHSHLHRSSRPACLKSPLTEFLCASHGHIGTRVENIVPLVIAPSSQV